MHYDPYLGLLPRPETAPRRPKRSRRNPQPGSHPGADLDAFDTAPPPKSAPRWRRSHRATLALAALPAIAAMAPASWASAHEGDHGESAERPTVTFTADESGLKIPAEVPGGLVDITLATEPSDVGHNVAIGRLNDGYTFDDAVAAGFPAAIAMVTVKGGAGGAHRGEDVHLTLDLEAGDYLAIHNPQAPEPELVGFTATEPASDAPEPEAEAAAQVGPGMLIAPPVDFDGSGTILFENADPELIHEAFVAKVPDGVTVADVVAWADDGMQGPPPIGEELPGLGGALGPGERAWIDVDLEPGTYVMVCFVPAPEDGSPHLAHGMIAPFTIAG